MKIKLLLLLGLSYFTGYAQVGINTKQPKATLEIDPSSSISPTGTDGILIPRVNQFPVTPAAKGQLVYMLNNTNAAITDGFYIWDGVKWDPLVKAPYIIAQDESIFVATGTGYTPASTNSNSETVVNIGNITGKDLTGFSVSGNNVIVGKAGKYFLNFFSGFKAITGSRRATFEFKLKKNGTTVITTSASVPNEPTTASNITMSNVVTLAVGDQISVTVTKVSEPNTSSVTYAGFGNNCIKLTFLHD